MARFHRSCARRDLRMVLLVASVACVGLLSTGALAGARSHNPSAQSGHGSPSAERIVRFAPGTSAAEMQQIVTDAGGEVATVMPEISAVGVRSDDSSFENTVQASPKVQALFVDRYISWAPSDERLSAPGSSSSQSSQLSRSYSKLYSSLSRSDSGSAKKGQGGKPNDGFSPDPLHDAAAPNAEGILQWDDNRMNVPSAWKKTRGDKSIVVAVLDTGVDGNTKELRDNYDARRSDNSLDCKTIIREYGLGFLRGNGILDECRDGDTDGHGTWVASRIAASANGLGSNGVAPSVTVRSYKVLAGDFGGLTSWIVNGMVEACHDGADILNMSIVGYDDPSYEYDAQDYLLWADAANYCHSRGTAIIASAGNEHVQINRTNITVAGRTFYGAGRVTTGSKGIGTVYPGDSLQPYVTDVRGMLLVPGGLPGVILVSATSNEVVNAPDALPQNRWPAKWVGARDQLAYYSNYGSRIDLAAPGGARQFNIPLFDGGADDILANGYGSLSAVDKNSALCTDPELSTSYNSACFSISGQGFAWSQGTSMSAPNVSGVAALVLSNNGSLRDRPDALLARLTSTARDDVANYTGPNDPNNTTAAIDGTPCDIGYCHLDFAHPISSGDAYGAGIADAGDAVS
jgi:subtilisin family serine protease